MPYASLQRVASVLLVIAAVAVTASLVLGAYVWLRAGQNAEISARLLSQEELQTSLLTAQKSGRKAPSRSVRKMA